MHSAAVHHKHAQCARKTEAAAQEGYILYDGCWPEVYSTINNETYHKCSREASNTL